MSNVSGRNPLKCQMVVVGGGGAQETTFPAKRGFNFSICTRRTRFCPVPLWHCGVSIFLFVLDEPDSVRFHHDIIFCLESDSIVVSFSSGTGFFGEGVLGVFAKENSNWESPWIVTEEFYASIVKKSTQVVISLNLVPENKDKPRLFIGEERGGVLLSRDNVRY